MSLWWSIWDWKQLLFMKTLVEKTIPIFKSHNGCQCHLHTLIMSVTAICCYTFHTSSPHGLHKGHQSVLWQVHPFALKNLEELSSALWGRMSVIDSPGEQIPEILDWSQVRWLRWPIHRNDRLVSKEILDDVRTMWNCVIVLEDCICTHGLKSWHDERL